MSFMTLLDAIAMQGEVIGSLATFIITMILVVALIVAAAVVIGRILDKRRPR